MIDADLVDSFFGGTRRQALHSYVSLLKRERNERWVSGRLEQLPWWTAEPAVEKIGHGVDALGRSAVAMRQRCSAGEFLVRVEPLLGVEIREVAGAQRSAAVLVARELVAALAVERWGVGVKALADALGKSRDGVSHWVRRAAHRRAEEPAFARRLDELDRKLAGKFER